MSPLMVQGKFVEGDKFERVLESGAKGDDR